MDTAVGLVQSYLYMNGYFTVTEYPVLELMADGEYRTVTDVDMLALRIPGAGRQGDMGTVTVFDPDPNLDIDFDRVDLIVGEVKEGRAELNSSARDPKVLRAALNRFGAVPEEQIAPVIDQLLEDGEAEHPEGARVRLMSFGSRPPMQRPTKYRWMLLGDLAGFMHRTITENWSAAQTIQSKDPALSFLLLLEKSVRGEQ
ncbi:MAG TPA: hypothetical protein VFD97_07140 [Acidimicrobiia bacterium]|nr:hypothetical protein [Acidimicrobiia bacterium]